MLIALNDTANVTLFIDALAAHCMFFGLFFCESLFIVSVTHIIYLQMLAQIKPPLRIATTS